jgi:hypothetical protein
MRVGRALFLAAVPASLVVAVAAATAAPKAWDKSASIVTSAERLAALQRGKGAIATYEFILNCYKTHRLAEAFSEPLAGCIVQDYLNSKVTAAVYDRVDPATRKKLGAPSPEQLMKVMSARIIDAYRQYGIGEADVRAFLQKVDAEGMPHYLAKRFPQAAGGSGAEKPPDAAAPPR